MNSTSTNDVLMHHLTAFGNNDLEEIMKDYTDASTILTPDGVLTTLDAIRKFFADYFLTIPKGSTFKMKQMIISNTTAYIVWASKSEVAEILLGTDTFFMEANKIRMHTVADCKKHYH